MAERVQDGDIVLLRREDPWEGKREDSLYGLSAMMRLARVRHDAPVGEETSGPDLPRASTALRATLLAAAIEAVDDLGVPHNEAAAWIGTVPETLDLLLQGQIDRFDSDTLVDMLARLGYRVDVTVGRRGEERVDARA